MPVAFLFFSPHLLKGTGTLLLFQLLIGLDHHLRGLDAHPLLLFVAELLLLCLFLSKLLLQLLSFGLGLLLAHLWLLWRRRRWLEQGQVDVGILCVVREPVDRVLQAGVVSLEQSLFCSELGETHLHDLALQILVHFLLDLWRVRITWLPVVRDVCCCVLHHDVRAGVCHGDVCLEAIQEFVRELVNVGFARVLAQPCLSSLQRAFVLREVEGLCCPCPGVSLDQGERLQLFLVHRVEEPVFLPRSFLFFLLQLHEVRHRLLLKGLAVWVALLESLHVSLCVSRPTILRADPDLVVHRDLVEVGVLLPESLGVLLGLLRGEEEPACLSTPQHHLRHGHRLPRPARSVAHGTGGTAAAGRDAGARAP
mmetsp:Transcript_37482/g.84509  ORF Transcript_37482/g.84509 Transcript_37482/m.84509 type:complete len:366 (+) Transcript_37482:510-1607(+)